MLLAATIGLGASGRDGFSRGESELKCDAALGGGDVLPCSFGAVVDLVGWVGPEVVAWNAGVVRRCGLAWLHGCCRSIPDAREFECRKWMLVLGKSMGWWTGFTRMRKMT